MKERPILFSTPMVQAILDGRKTQTRRVVKFPESNYPNGWCGGKIDDNKALFYNSTNDREFDAKCPYGKPGDILWVRETFLVERSCHKDFYEYKADYTDTMASEVTWKPSIFMPKEACRIKLEVTDVRVERLNDISEDDCIAEGIEKVKGPRIGYPFVAQFSYVGKHGLYQLPQEAYASLWESINGKGSWEKNPWVWVITFKKL